MPASRFVWVELMTSDASAAVDFYARVVGWSARDAGMPGMAYTLLQVGDAGVAGVMATPAELQSTGAVATWSGYLAVDDVDAMAAGVLAGGGKVLQPAGDIPGVGRFAVVADPQGASFMLFRPIPPAQAPVAPPGDAPGTVGWHELRAMDGPAVFDFYAALFGWTKGEGLDMGPPGTYQLFEIDGVPAGAVMTRTPDAPAPAWRYYFRVDSIAAAAQRIAQSGGVVTMGPEQVPDGSWMLSGRDPQGAVFALISKTK
jgi:predicted enzyme related to lactoylglutathione lyase